MIFIAIVSCNSPEEIHERNNKNKEKHRILIKTVYHQIIQTLFTNLKTLRGGCPSSDPFRNPMKMVFQIEVTLNI